MYSFLVTPSRPSDHSSNSSTQPMCLKKISTQHAVPRFVRYMAGIGGVMATLGILPGMNAAELLRPSGLPDTICSMSMHAFDSWSFGLFSDHGSS